MNKTKGCIAQLVFAVWLMVLVICALPGPASGQTISGRADAQMLFPDADFFEQIQPAPVFAARTAGSIHATALPDSKASRESAWGETAVRRIRRYDNNAKKKKKAFQILETDYISL